MGQKEFGLKSGVPVRVLVTMENNFTTLFGWTVRSLPGVWVVSCHCVCSI